MSSASNVIVAETDVTTAVLSPEEGEEEWRDFLSRLGMLANAPELAAVGLIRLDTVLANEETLLDDSNLHFLKPLQRRKLRAALLEVRGASAPTSPSSGETLLTTPARSDTIESADSFNSTETNQKNPIVGTPSSSRSSSRSRGRGSTETKAVTGRADEARSMGNTLTEVLPVSRGYRFSETMQLQPQGSSEEEYKGLSLNAAFPPPPPSELVERQPLPLCRGYSYDENAFNETQPLPSCRGYRFDANAIGGDSS